MMAMVTSYETIKTAIRPGDVIAFGGNGIKSRGISLATHSAVSHVAAVVRTHKDREGGPAGLSHLIIEATWLLGEKPGVNAHWLDERLKTYFGAMWWLPLRRSVRRSFDVENFQGFMLSQLGAPFDFVQCLQAAPDATDEVPGLRGLTYAPEDLRRLFCSELVAAGLRAGGAVQYINCSEVTPADISQFSLYEPHYVQLKGSRRRIQGFNSRNPEHWGLVERQEHDRGFAHS